MIGEAVGRCRTSTICAHSSEYIHVRVFLCCVYVLYYFAPLYRFNWLGIRRNTCLRHTCCTVVFRRRFGGKFSPCLGYLRARYISSLRRLEDEESFHGDERTLHPSSLSRMEHILQVAHLGEHFADREPRRHRLDVGGHGGHVHAGATYSTPRPIFLYFCMQKFGFFSLVLSSSSVAVYIYQYIL